MLSRGRGAPRVGALACASAAALAALALTACGSGTHGKSTHAKTGSRTATTRAASATVTSGPTLPISTPALSPAGLARAIDDLYRRHPDLSSYVVQGTTYTTHSRNVVLGVCTTGGTAEMTANTQTARLDACAPLIFFYYNYGVSHHASDAVKVADDIYSYAASVINGPLDSASALGDTLHTWGIRVNGASTGTPTSKTAANVTKLLDTVDRDILAQGSVRVTVLGRRPSSSAVVERLVEDIATDSARETVTEPGAYGSITVTPAAAYLSGDNSGLTKLMGLSAAQAKVAGSRWIRVPKGSAEYSDLAAEDTITALPASILPAASTSVSAQTRYEGGMRVQLLTWKVTASSQVTIEETLKLTSGADPLPIEETTASGGYGQTVDFTRWGMPIVASAPTSGATVAYAALPHR